ncbi:cation diffusion facilitator family transporter [Leptolyngbya cf. ectocarpi LEGE 11479]|uniref:Cation diffusion facilitator family transporter n=1 Tax=Leptolyngbya cf. ectocarpi LEGE 11479 TaxID=1828722 RepID=A0A928ZSB3_LEPEC|nr:cation diffusion facilitator family transporter [Leptolyngbya ectocarpi]MBE9065952.1 cation diffusion facilitator family transporter [Leptolyngbya cf. ectocarpi LEGE 11479]
MVLDAGQQRQICYRLLLMMLWANLVILTIEVTAGWASHSIGLLAEALHTLIDVFSMVLSLTAVASPQRTLGREIWGHGRGEAGGALILAAILGFFGVNILLVAVGQLEAAMQGANVPFPVEVTVALIQLVMAMVVIALMVALWVSYQGRYLHSVGLKLTTQHVLGDGWLSIAMLLGLVGIWRGHTWLDPLIAIALIILTLHSFWRVLNTQLPMLLRPTAIAPESIAQVVTTVEGVTRCNRIRSRGMVGRHVWIELYLAVHPEFLTMAHTISERVESALRHHYGPVSAQIWIEQDYTLSLQTYY